MRERREGVHFPRVSSRLLKGRCEVGSTWGEHPKLNFPKTPCVAGQEFCKVEPGGVHLTLSGTGRDLPSVFLINKWKLTSYGLQRGILISWEARGELT